MTNNWLLRAEYLHYEISGHDVFGVPRVGFPAELSNFSHGRLRIDTVRAGISYKWGGPVVARY
jgi:opacity protein-like surface antigen